MSRSTILWFSLAVSLVFAAYNIVSMTIRQNNDQLEQNQVTVRIIPNKKDADQEVTASMMTDPVLKRPHLVGDSTDRRPFHVAMTATDSPYSKWQSRIMYYWYKRYKDEPGSEMGDFTRVLHSGEPDSLMDEIPSFVVDPLPAVAADHGFVVLNRPWAFVQWLEKAQIKEEYIMMVEPDHLIVKSIPNFSWENSPAGFPFDHMTPKAPAHRDIIAKYYPPEKGPVTDVDPIGSSPVIIRKSLLKEIAPSWMNISIKMKEDPDANTTFGWGIEMYAYAIASALHGVEHVLRKDFMVQPPYDSNVQEKYIIHYTYPSEYYEMSEPPHGMFRVWRFDKLDYIQGPPPRHLTLPPPQAPKSVVTLIKMINEATEDLPGWEEEVQRSKGSANTQSDASTQFPRLKDLLRGRIDRRNAYTEYPGLGANIQFPKFTGWGADTLSRLLGRGAFPGLGANTQFPGWEAFSGLGAHTRFSQFPGSGANIQFPGWANEKSANSEKPLGGANTQFQDANSQFHQFLGAISQFHQNPGWDANTHFPGANSQFLQFPGWGANSQFFKFPGGNAKSTVNGNTHMDYAGADANAQLPGLGATAQFQFPQFLGTQANMQFRGSKNRQGRLENREKGRGESTESSNTRSQSVDAETQIPQC